METKRNFTEGKILAPLLLFAGPVLFALFLQAMYGAVDLHGSAREENRCKAIGICGHTDKDTPSLRNECSL